MTDDDIWFTLCVGDREISVSDDGVSSEAKDQFETFVHSQTNG